MPVQYGTVKRFNSLRGWGFVRIASTETDAIIYVVDKCQILSGRLSPSNRLPLEERTSVLREEDELVVNVRQREDGKAKVVAWAFRSEWEAVKIRSVPAPVSDPALPEAPPPVPAPARPEGDPPLTFEEMLRVFDFRFLHALLDAMEKGELPLSVIELFARNTPKGKRGEALWKEFHKWKPAGRGKHGIAAFMRQVLIDTGFIVE